MAATRVIFNAMAEREREREFQCDVVCTHLGREHVVNPVKGALEEERPHQEADQHHVGEQGAEVHHLRDTKKQTQAERSSR